MAGRRGPRAAAAAAVPLGVALLTVLAVAGPAAAAGGLPEPTPGVQSLTAAGGEVFFYLPADGGRRWFPFCPQARPPQPASDVCGGTGAGEKVYAGRTFFPDPGDSRCVVVAAHNQAVRPSDVVLPAKCYDLPLMFGVPDRQVVDNLATLLTQTVGSCAGSAAPPPGSGCANPLMFWPRRQGTGMLDCAAVPAARLPAQVAAYTDTGRDTRRLRQVCDVVDAYLGAPAASPPPTPAAVALGDAAFDLYAAGAGGRAPTQNTLDLGLFTLNLTEGCANGNSVACGLDATANTLACASDPLGCLGRWLAAGAVSAVHLLGEVISAPPPVDLTSPAFRTVYEPMGLASAYLALLLLLVNAIVCSARLHPAGIGQALAGVVRYGLGLAAMLTLTVTALDLAHTLTVGIAGDQASLQALTTRFEQAVTSSLSGSPAAPTAFIAILALLMLLAAAFTWLIMYGRGAAVLIICAFSPVLLAGQAGPGWARAWAPRAVKLLAAVIFAQPVAAIFYRLGVGLMAYSPGPGNLVTALIILLLVGFTPWMLLSFIGITTAALATEQTRARSHSGSGLSAAALAAATLRANAPAPATHAAAAGAVAPAATTTTGAGATRGTAGAGTGGGGWGRAAAIGLLAAAAAQQVGAHLGDQVTTGGGATGDAPRSPQTPHTYGMSLAARTTAPPAPTGPAAAPAGGPAPATPAPPQQPPPLPVQPPPVSSPPRPEATDGGPAGWQVPG